MLDVLYKPALSQLTYCHHASLFHSTRSIPFFQSSLLPFNKPPLITPSLCTPFFTHLTTSNQTKPLCKKCSQPRPRRKPSPQPKSTAGFTIYPMATMKNNSIGTKFSQISKNMAPGKMKREIKSSNSLLQLALTGPRQGPHVILLRNRSD